MRRADRLFQIVQYLRGRRLTTAAQLADWLQVSARTVYRDIQDLERTGVPIEGEAGVGYRLRPEFDLPPLMFSIEETEAIVLSLALLERTGDEELRQAARRVNQKIAGAVPAPLRQAMESKALYAWGTVAPPPASFDLGLARRAIRDEQKLVLDYRDELGRATERVIRPIALIYYSHYANLVGWCELRQAIRNFRSDRIAHCEAGGAFFRGDGDRLRADWMSGWANPPA